MDQAKVNTSSEGQIDHLYMAGHISQLVCDPDSSSVRIVSCDFEEKSTLHLYGDLGGSIDAGLQGEDAVWPYVEAVQ